jgi:hypothetical protein
MQPAAWVTQQQPRGVHLEQRHAILDQLLGELHHVVVIDQCVRQRHEGLYQSAFPRFHMISSSSTMVVRRANPGQSRSLWSGSNRLRPPRHSC